MKLLLTNLLLCLMSVALWSQAELGMTIKAEDVKSLKRAKGLFVVLPEEDDIAANMKAAFADHWQINKDIRYAKKSEKVKKEGRPSITLNLHTLERETTTNNLPTGSQYMGSTIKMTIKASGEYLNIGMRKNTDLSYGDFADVINRLQFVLLEIEEEGSWGKAFRKTKDKYGKELEDKVLLVDESLLKDGINEEDIREVYPYEFEIVTTEKVNQALKEKDINKAYLIVVEEKVGLYVQYICNAGDGKIYTHIHNSFHSIGGTTLGFNKMISKSDLKSLSGRVK